MNKLIIFVFILTISNLCFGQDPVFNQTDNNRNYLNPAYIGTEKSFSADVSYRNQWPELSGSYKTMVVQVNQYLGKGNGVSIHFVNDNAANTVMKSEFGLGYAKRFTMGENHHIAIGTQVSYFQKSLNYDNLTFGNMIDPQGGFVYTTADPIVWEPVNGVDFNAGILYYNKHFFAGFVTKHLSQPNESFFGGESALPMLHALQVGGKFNLDKVAFIPSVRWFNQSSFNTAFASLKVVWKKMEVDAGLQFNSGIFGGVGFNTDYFNIGYNYTKVVSKITSTNLSTHEVRLGCDFTLFNRENEYFFDF